MRPVFQCYQCREILDTEERCAKHSDTEKHREGYECVVLDDFGVIHKVPGIFWMSLRIALAKVPQ